MSGYVVCPREILEGGYVKPTERAYLAQHPQLGDVSVFGVVLRGWPDKELRGKIVVHRGEMEGSRIKYYLVDQDSLERD